MNDKPSSSKSSSPLPLDWTRIKRRRKRQKTTATATEDDNNNETDKFWFCCEDPSCNEQEINYKHIFGKDRKSASSSQSKMTSLKGKGLFCLHSLDCTWFQGHFIPSRMNSSSFGLLAIQREDVDDCLQCKDGGYKEIDLTILSASKKKNVGNNAASKSSGSAKEDQRNSNLNDIENGDDAKTRQKQNGDNATKRRKLKVEKLQCTGGDMLRITTSNNGSGSDDFETPTLNNNVTADDSSGLVEDGDTNVDIKFDAERIITGRRVKRLVEKYFSNLVPSISSSTSTDIDSLSDLLPDCAIVIGEMYIRVPSEFVYGRENEMGNYKDDNGVDDDWLE